MRCGKPVSMGARDPSRRGRSSERGPSRRSHEARSHEARPDGRAGGMFRLRTDRISRLRFLSNRPKRGRSHSTVERRAGFLLLPLKTPRVHFSRCAATNAKDTAPL